jgi:outer membrane receptor protein involved in Fe transport
MLNVLIIAAAMWSGVAGNQYPVAGSSRFAAVVSSQYTVVGNQSPVGSSRFAAVVSSQYPVVSNQGEISSLYSPISTLYSPISTLYSPISTLYSPISTLYSPFSTLEKDSTLADVSISAPKYPEKLARTGKVVSVISAEMIQANQGKSLGELLQQSVGVAVVGARSAPGTNQEIYVRGANTGHVLLLMDGFPLNDPSHISSVMDWNLINLSNIERIEILKGGQSTLYGSDAMAAVINLVTRKNAKSLQVVLQGGGLGTHQEQISWSTRKGNNSLQFRPKITRQTVFLLLKLRKEKRRPMDLSSKVGG